MGKLNKRTLFWFVVAAGAWYVAKKRTEAAPPATILPAASGMNTNVSPTAAPTTSNMQALAGLGAGFGPVMRVPPRPYGNPGASSARINPMAMPAYTAPRGLIAPQRRTIF